MHMVVVDTSSTSQSTRPTRRRKTRWAVKREATFYLELCFKTGNSAGDLFEVVTHLKLNSSPLKSYLSNRRVLFQLPFFRVTFFRVMSGSMLNFGCVRDPFNGCWWLPSISGVQKGQFESPGMWCFRTSFICKSPSIWAIWFVIKIYQDEPHHGRVGYSKGLRSSKSCGDEAKVQSPKPRLSTGAPRFPGSGPAAVKAARRHSDDCGPALKHLTHGVQKSTFLHTFAVLSNM